VPVPSYSSYSVISYSHLLHLLVSPFTWRTTWATFSGGWRCPKVSGTGR
jgi:hypothetical protein